MGRTSSAKAARWTCKRPAPTGASAYESFAPVHLAAGSDLAAHGRTAVGGRCRIPRAAGLSPAAGGLSDHPGAHLLSRREPGGDGLLGHRALRAHVRADAGHDPDA